MRPIFVPRPNRQNAWGMHLFCSMITVIQNIAPGLMDRDTVNENTDGFGG